MDSQTAMQGDFLERLCRANEGQLEAYLTQMVGSADIARELVKDTFARVRMSPPEQAAFPRAALCLRRVPLCNHVRILPCTAARVAHPLLLAVAFGVLGMLAPVLAVPFTPGALRARAWFSR
jgi:hypothetical protein